MPGSDQTWRPARILAFLALGLALYAGLFLWSDATLRNHGRQNPFLRIAQAPDRTDWIILGASHALPLGFADMPEVLLARTGQRTLTLGMTGGGPLLLRLIAERWFSDHRTAGVLIVLDAFGFADPRWNEPRLADSDLLPKIPADAATTGIFARAVARGLSWQTLVAYASGFARINDHTRFSPDIWQAEAKFDAAPRPSAAATKARIAFLYPDPPQPAALERGFTDLAAVILLAQQNGARVAIVRPPLPEGFRTGLPEVPGFEARLAELASRLGVPVFDFAPALPETRHYFDADHLNRAGVLRWLEVGLADVLTGRDDRDQ